MRQEKWWRFCLCLSGRETEIERKKGPKGESEGRWELTLSTVSELASRPMADNMSFLAFCFRYQWGIYFFFFSHCYYYYYFIYCVALDEVCIVLWRLLWKECFQQWCDILEWMAFTQFLLLRISYAITSRNLSKMKYEKKADILRFFSLLSFSFSIMLFLFCFIFELQFRRYTIYRCVPVCKAFTFYCEATMTWVS